MTNESRTDLKFEWAEGRNPRISPEELAEALRPPRAEGKITVAHSIYNADGTRQPITVYPPKPNKKLIRRAKQAQRRIQR